MSDQVRIFGCIPSPPDPRDLPLSAAFDRLGIEAAPPPPSFSRPHVGPLLNQGSTPQCVAYSSAGSQMWLDYTERGKWYSFDYAHHFRDIGGGSYGAYLRDSLVRRVNYGYPEKGLRANDANHRLKMFVRVPVTRTALMQAIVLAPLLIGVRWNNAWMHTLPDGMLPEPKGGDPGRHALWVPSYVPRGIVPRNSWGAWGAQTPTAPRGNGNCVLGWDYLDRVYDAWSIIDLPTK